MIGVCSTIPNKPIVCLSSIGEAPADLSKYLLLPDEVVQRVLALQHSVSLALPALSSMLYFLGVVAYIVVGCSSREKTRRRYISTTRVFLWSSVATAFAAAYSLNFSISAMEVVSPSQSSTGLAVIRGQALQILQWMVFSFTALYAFSVHQMTHRTLKAVRMGLLPVSQKNIPRKSIPSAAPPLTPVPNPAIVAGPWEPSRDYYGPEGIAK